MEVGKTILITGANGFVGKYIAKDLADKGFKITAIVRKKEWGHPNIKFIESSLEDIDALGLNKDSFDFVIHSAAKLAMYDKRGDLAKGNIELTKIILDFFKDSSCYFIYFSSVQAFGPTGEREVSENDNPKPTTDYGKFKLKTEKIVEESGLKYSILRLGNVSGQKKGMLESIENILEGKGVLNKLQSFLLRNVLTKYELNFVHLEDIAGAIERIIEIKPENQIYFLTNCRLSMAAIAQSRGKKTCCLPLVVFLLIFICKISRSSNLICYIVQGGCKRKYMRYSRNKITRDLKYSFKNYESGIKCDNPNL